MIIFGWSVDINYAGDRIVVGAPNDDNGGSNSGSVRVLIGMAALGHKWVINGSGSSDNLGYSLLLIIQGIKYWYSQK